MKLEIYLAYKQLPFSFVPSSVIIVLGDDNMYYNDSIIQAYLTDCPISKEVLYPIIKDYRRPDKKRKEIVAELHRQLKDIVDAFPVFNVLLWNTLFQDKDDYIDQMTICPIVGSHQLFEKIVYHNQLYLVIDLICVANVTSIVSQMVYIMKNQISYEVARLCILKDYPLSSQKYVTLLNTSAFVNGLSHYLAWNETCANYRFYTDKYEPHKEKVFSLLSQAMQIENKAMQHKILLHIQSGDLWEQFPAAAGMFYFDDIYRELGLAGIRQLYFIGPAHFIQTIFES